MQPSSKGRQKSSTYWKLVWKFSIFCSNFPGSTKAYIQNVLQFRDKGISCGVRKWGVHTIFKHIKKKNPNANWNCGKFSGLESMFFFFNFIWFNSYNTVLINYWYLLLQCLFTVFISWIFTQKKYFVVRNSALWIFCFCY